MKIIDTGNFFIINIQQICQYTADQILIGMDNTLSDICWLLFFMISSVTDKTV